MNLWWMARHPSVARREFHERVGWTTHDVSSTNARDAAAREIHGHGHGDAGNDDGDDDGDRGDAARAMELEGTQPGIDDCHLVFFFFLLGTRPRG